MNPNSICALITAWSHVTPAVFLLNITQCLWCERKNSLPKQAPFVPLSFIMPTSFSICFVRYVKDSGRTKWRKAIQWVKSEIFCWTCRPEVENTLYNKGGGKFFVGVKRGMKICSGWEERALYFKTPTSWKIDSQEVIARCGALGKSVGIWVEKFCSR